MQLECGMPPRSGLQALPEQEVDLTIKVRFMIQQSLPEQVVQFSIFSTIVTINLLCSDCPLVARAEGLSILLFIPEYPHWLRTYFAYTQGKIQQPQRNLFDPRYCIDTLNHLFIFVLLLYLFVYICLYKWHEMLNCTYTLYYVISII